MFQISYYKNSTLRIVTTGPKTAPKLIGLLQKLGCNIMLVKEL
jgi:hypothetical protein